jgi:glycosyltransferase involved in cell wall biosynthesis
VIVSSSDEAVRLEKTLESIGQAPAVPLEIVLMDGTSSRNRIAETSRAPLLAFVAPGTILLPGALDRLAAICSSDPSVGLACGYSFRVDRLGRAHRDGMRSRRDALDAVRRAGGNKGPEKLLAEHGMNVLRVYRRDTLREAGGFDESLPAGSAEIDVARRIARLARIHVVPEFVCGYRDDGPRSQEPQASPISPLARIAARASDAVYAQIATRLRWWPIELLPWPRRTSAPKRTAYYTWQFPVLSQTFIHRELAALSDAGIDVEILTAAPVDADAPDDNAKKLLERTHRLGSIDAGRLRRYRKILLRRRPLAYLNLALFVRTRQYGPFKDRRDDARVFASAVYLAGFMRERGIDHVHAPWADRCAFVALVASKLAGISYSVQGRAHDIHRASYLFGLREKLEHARFVVANTGYNAEYLRGLVPRRHHAKITRIPNGLDLDRFAGAPRTRSANEPLRILAVARLIEQKGLPYLLEACDLLRTAGRRVTCEIVGGPEHPLYTAYAIELKKLHRGLGLAGVVRFHGAKPFAETLAFYRDADVFVLPCVIAADGSRDITPNALIEAMAMKLPVISTTVTAIPEIVENGVSGLLVPPADARALATAIETVAAEPRFARDMGEHARRRVEALFDIRRNVRRYAELFSGHPHVAIPGLVAAGAKVAQE